MKTYYAIQICTLTLLSSFALQTVEAQVNVQSKYLQNPELGIELADSSAKFWFDSFDEQEGAFFTNVARNGEPSDDEKQMITQSQNAYGMARAFQLTGDTTYLNYGRRALDWMYENSWDEEHGGWLKDSDQKYAFDQHYALIGPSAMFEAGNDSLDWKWLMKGYESNQNLWDDRPEFYGYYSEANLDWSGKNAKTFSATVDGITTHALYMYLMTKDEKYKERLIQLGDNIIDYFVASMEYMDLGFNESYDSNWGWDSSPNWQGNVGDFPFTGHFTKSAWCLARIYQVVQKPEYLEAAQKILNDVLAKQSQYDEKISQWWEYEEGFTSGVMNYYLTEKSEYLEFADGNLMKFMETLWDTEYGEFYFFENNDHKGSYYKTSYHSVEMFYYVYLYGNLYLYDEPVSLYYRIIPTEEERTISLYPLAFRDSLLTISEVTLEGESFPNFNNEDRSLTIAANEGGIYKVTFQANEGSATGIEPESEQPAVFALSQNYPNPFNPTTQIEYSLNESGPVSLRVYNIIGKEVATLVTGNQSAGSHRVEFDANKLPSGVYLYQLRFGNRLESRKMMLIK